MKVKKVDRTIPKRKITILIGILAGGVLGFFAGYLGVFLDSRFIPSEFKAFPLIITVVIFCLAYFFAVSVHELTHFFAFKKNGINMRALFLTIFLFIKEEDKWKFKLKPNAVTLIGGIAIPDIPAVRNGEDFKKVQKALANAIIAAPIASILLFPVIMLLSLPAYFFNVSVYVKSFVFTFDVSLFAITVFLVLTCFIKSELAIGDFPAYKLAKYDDFFTAIQVCQYMVFSSQPDKVREESKFLYERIDSYLQKEYEKRASNIYTLGILDFCISLYLAGEADCLTETAKKYIKYFMENEGLLLAHKNSEISKALLFHIISYMGENEATRQNALVMFKTATDSIKKRTRVIDYYIKQTEQLLKLKDNSQYLSEKTNIRTSSAWGIWSVFPKYYELESKINKRQLFK